MLIAIFTLLILLLAAFFIYKIKDLFSDASNLIKKNKQPQEGIQLAKKEDQFTTHRTTKFTRDELKSGYSKLSDFVIHGLSKDDLDQMFSNIEEVKSKDVKPSQQGLYYLEQLMNQNIKIESFYFFYLDWKSKIDDLLQHIEKRLLLNKIKAELPLPINYPKNITVSYNTIFKDYNIALNQVGLGLWFIKTPSDQYIVFLYKLDKLDETFWALSHIGLNIESYKPEWNSKE